MGNMKTAATVLFTLLFALSATNVSLGEKDEEADSDLAEWQVRGAGALNTFGCLLYTKLADAGPRKNVLISPYSIASALGMTAAGARGETASEMAGVLFRGLEEGEENRAFGALNRISKAASHGWRLSLANALWGQRGEVLLDDFLKTNRDFYGAQLTLVNFKDDAESARKIINSWVSEKTEKRIPDLLKPGDVTSDTPLVLTNAIYFKGRWKTPFEKRRTRKQNFKLESGEHVPVDMMIHNEGTFGYYKDSDDGHSVLELPYGKKGELSMLLFLPGPEQSLSAIESKLAADGAVDCVQRLVEEEMTLVAVPRFTFRYRRELSGDLKKMGMKKAFDGGEADFSGMTGSQGYFIALVIHEAFIEVNEEGTEAAAATAVTMDKGMPEPMEFVADRPFVFMIRHVDSGAILFMGRVADPR